MSLLDYFPDEFEPTDQQQNLLKQVNDAWDKHKFIIISAPTGYGKSLISKCIANQSRKCNQQYHDLVTTYRAFSSGVDREEIEQECYDNQPFGAVVLTITKQLQDQYIETFKDVKFLKGKSNYQCKVDENFTVDDAPCNYLGNLKRKCWREKTCRYYEYRNVALVAKTSVYNYSMFLSLPDHVKQREIMVCDECSELEDVLIRQFTLPLPYKILKLFGMTEPLPTTNYAKAYTWLNGLQSVLHDEIESLKSRLGKHAVEKDIKKFTLAQNLLQRVKEVINAWNKTEFLIERKDDRYLLTPLNIDALAHQLFDCANKIVLMSATIINPHLFAKQLGITDYCVINAQTDFDPKKSPIYVNNKLHLSQKNLDQNLPVIAKQIREICTKHKRDKGIIHTHTHKITQYLSNHLKSDRFLFRDAENINEELLQEHIDREDATVLVSPSLTHGVDLKDDLARFQIIVKAPFPSLGDLRTKTLFDKDKDWYETKMLKTLVQACGRGTRTKDDWCVTYVLDGSVIRAISRYKTELPQYFVERIF